MMNIFIRSEFNYDMLEASNASGLECKDPSLAKQSFGEEVDINTIIRRFRIGGELPVGVRMPTYGDFTDVSDFKTAMDALALANEAFERMPAEVRARFGNDTQAFVEFCSDDKNMEEARKLGLVPAAEVPATLVAPPPAAAAYPELTASASAKGVPAKVGTVST